MDASALDVLTARWPAFPYFCGPATLLLPLSLLLGAALSTVAACCAVMDSIPTVDALTASKLDGAWMKVRRVLVFVERSL